MKRIKKYIAEKLFNFVIKEYGLYDIRIKQDTIYKVLFIAQDLYIYDSFNDCNELIDEAKHKMAHKLANKIIEIIPIHINEDVIKRRYECSMRLPILINGGNQDEK